MNCTTVPDSDGESEEEEEKGGEQTQEPITMQGYLTKQGKVVKNWKRRWFVLQESRLFYYKTPTVSYCLFVSSFCSVFVCSVG
jgi:hypothetical protein